MFRGHVPTVQASKAHATVNSAGINGLLLVLWSWFDYVVARQRRAIPTGCRDELKRSHGRLR